MRRILLYIILGFTLNVSAQVLDEDVKVLEKIAGEAWFSLNKGERVYTFEPEEGWYKIRKRVRVDPSAIVDEKYLAAGTELKGADGKKIGEVLKEVKIKDKRLIEGFRSQNEYIVILEGYIFKTRIEDGSIPEDRISELLNEKNRNIQFTGFQELFDEYHFEKREFEDLTAYAFRDNNFSADEENDFRVIMVFRGESSVYAIITNNHKIEPSKVKDVVQDGNFTITYLYKPSSSYKQLIEDTILYTFLAL